MATILIIDDGATDRDLLSRVVTGLGHRALTATDGKDGIAQAKAQKPSMIFLDVVMPVMDGFATCRTLTKDAETASIPVVLVTSKANESDVFWGRKQGASDHVGKPWDRAKIEEIIRRHCK